MIPENKLSSELVFSDWLIDKPDDDFKPLSGFTLGGDDLYSNTTNLGTHLWKYWYENNKIIVQREDDESKRYELFEMHDVSELSVTFNQSMSPEFVYVHRDDVFLGWFDTADQEFKTTQLDQSYKSPKIILDFPDKYSKESDVVLVYTNNYRQLCVRYQRERYTREHILKNNIKPHILIRVGLNVGNRLQFVLEEYL